MKKLILLPVAAVTRVSPRLLFSEHTTGFIHERMFKGTGVGVERGCLEV